MMKVTGWLGIGSFILILMISPANADAQYYQQKLANAFSQLDGKAFTGIELENEKGELFNTASLKGKTIYADFWFTQCPPCLHEIPYAAALQEFFAADTNLVFVSICIETIERKEAWKNMIAGKKMGGIQLFYARNRPQKINLLREYRINDFPTYLVIDSSQKIIGYDAPAPSQAGWVHWALTKAIANVRLADAYKQVFTPAFTTFTKTYQEKFKNTAVSK
jgi:thiol-disulfide isomerase/thioredoxin